MVKMISILIFSILALKVVKFLQLIDCQEISVIPGIIYELVNEPSKKAPSEYKRRRKLFPGANIS